MSTCPECFEDMGCTCEERKRIAELEAENKRLRELLVRATNKLFESGNADMLICDIERTLHRTVEPVEEPNKTGGEG